MLPAIRNNAVMTPWTTPINRLEGVFDRLFDDRLFGFSFGTDEPGVPVSFWQDEDHLYVEADLPGMADEDVEVTVHRGVLYIRGERKPEPDRQYLFNGRTWGRFERAITLPDEVETEAVHAELSRGVLRVSMPKRPESKPRKISLQSS